jgi:tetratricopeptide (TPR) repeat protein
MTAPDKPRKPGSAGRWLRRLCLGLGWLALVALSPLKGAEFAEAQQKFLAGDYADAIKLAEPETKERNPSDDWVQLFVQGLLTVGRYEDARVAITNALAGNSRSPRLVWLARDVFLSNGRTNEAAQMLERIKTMVTTRSANLRDGPSKVAFGRAALLLGADPKDVLDKIYGPTQQAEPKLREVFLARGELGLAKHDFALAAKAFEEGLKHHPTDPDLLCGLARSHAEGDRTIRVESLEAALKANPRHVPSLLILADHRIDSEDYEGALKLLDEIKAVNPWQPEALSLRAVIAHIRNDSVGEQTARDTALKFWPTNPNVYHLIGRKLSEKYRFAEGAAHQRQALAFDPGFLPAKAQLAGDLLRLGDEVEGWQLANEVHEKDAYDVAAFNLVTLKDTMAKYATLTNEHFIVRMHSKEAAIYGRRTLDLLERAHQKLCAKYGLTLTKPTTVEIFASQKDFGVRTFGMPENPGYLGVCFGSVVTANSPAANKASTVNWEAVLWHEFCHVVTLTLTKNKMPRWLSEGISTYEERQANPSWGEQLTPRYREMILTNDITPVSRLSAAFLMPKSPLHLQFAYYQASLVVEHIIEQHGVDSLKAVLRDLGDGVFINDALETHTSPMDKLEKSFTAFAKKKAEALAPLLSWEKPEPELLQAGSPADFAEWAGKHPNNYYGLLHSAKRLVEAKQWADAKPPLRELVEKYPSQAGNDSAYALLARAHRFLGETNDERQVLSKLAEVDAEATDAYLRLMELGSLAGDWTDVQRNAQRYLGVNPLVPAPYRQLARAAEQSGDNSGATDAWQTLLLLDPPNPAEVHFQLAKLLKPTDSTAAKRHVLQALEDAPRHRAALELLLELPSAKKEPASGSALEPAK